MGETRLAGVNARRWRVRTGDAAPLLCPVCRAVLVEPGEEPDACDHVLWLADEPDGPEVEHPGACRPACTRAEDPEAWEAYTAGRRELARRPDWVRVTLIWEGNPYNFTWRLCVAWPLDTLHPGDPEDAIEAALDELAAELEDEE